MKNFLHISISQADATSLEDLQTMKELNEQELALVVGGSRGHGHDHDHDHDRDDWHRRHWHHRHWHHWHHHNEHEHHGHK